jgi:hypothetical protein
MFRKIARSVCGVVLAFALTAGDRLPAQDAVLNEFYGSGVHQYFAGNYAQASSDLTASIDGGNKDPRAHYFRGLAALRLGWQKNAAADFRAGAALESADINQFYPVGKSLERVQGSSRMTLERYRAVARAEAHQRQERRNVIRYEQRKRAESQVLRAPGPTPPAARPAPSADDPAAAEDPFAEKDDKAESAEEMPGGKKPAAKDADEDPFAEPAAKEDAADKPAEPEEAMPAEDAADADSDAKGEKVGDDNPFGDDADSKPK